MVAKEVLEAASEGDLQVLKSFSEIGRVRDQYGATCLHYAARSDHVEVLEYLVKQRNFDSITRSNVGATPVHDAAAAGNLDSVKWFLNNTPCKVDDQDGSGATVVHLAARYGHTELVEWLMDNTNCDILKKAGSGAIPLHFAVLSGDLSCVKLLLSEAPRSVNAQLNNGVTPSYLACQEGQLEVLKHLVFQAGSNLKMNAFDAMSCVHAASQLGHLECVKFLVKDQKMNPNERDFDGATPLHFAASRGHPDIVDWLIKHGGARVTLDNLGGSPLHNAVEMGQVECVKTLLENGCDKKITDNQGLTAVELGEKCHQHQCVAVLKGEKLPEPTPPVKSEPPSVPKTTVAADSFVIPPLKSPSSNQLPSANRAALYRPVSVISTTSSNSEFGLSEPQAAGKQHQVAVEVHCDSRETGEKERVNIASINHSNPSASNHTRSEQNPILHENPLSLSKVPSKIQNGYHNFVVVGDPSSISPFVSKASNISSVNNHNHLDKSLNLRSNNNSIQNSYHQSDPSQKSSKRGSSYESANRYSQEIYRSDERRETTQSIASNMGDNCESSISSVCDQGLNKSVIKISKNNVEINHIGTDHDQKETLNGEIVNSDPIHSNIARISISGEPVDSSDSPSSPPLPPPPTPPDSTQTSPSNAVEAFPAPPTPPNQPSSPRKQPTSATDSISQGNGASGDRRLHTSPVKETNSNQRNSFHSNKSPPAMEQYVTPARPDIATEILRSGGSSSLRKSKPPTTGGEMNCVFSFGGKSSKAEDNENKEKPGSLTGEFDPKNFLKDVPEVDSSGVQIPEWRRQVLAKNLAQKAQADALEKQKS